MEATVLIEDLGKDGEGVGRAEGRVLFIPGATLGDRVRVSFDPGRRAFARAEVVERLESSPWRVPIICPIYEACGGCQTMELSYEAELEAKERRLKDALSRIGALKDPPVGKIIGAPSPMGYRQKATLPVGGTPGQIHLGYYAARTHRLVPVEACPVLDPAVEGAALKVASVLSLLGAAPFDEKTGQGDIKSVMIRHSVLTGEVMVVVTLLGDFPSAEFAAQLPLALPSLTSLHLARPRRAGNRLVGESFRHLFGEKSLTEGLLGLRFKISPGSFFQVNPVMAERVFEGAREAVREIPDATVLDLYSGTGTLALLSAASAAVVEGVERVGEAVRDARESALLNGIGNARFYEGSADAVLEERLGDGARYDVLVLDPPRKGAAEAVPLMIRAAPRRIVYISCDPATLARDVALLGEGGYRLTSARPFDLFPRTVHVESLAVLDRL